MLRNEWNEMKQAASVNLGRGCSGYTLQKPSQNKNVFVSNRFPVCARVSFTQERHPEAAI